VTDVCVSFGACLTRSLSVWCVPCARRLWSILRPTRWRRCECSQQGDHVVRHRDHRSDHTRKRGSKVVDGARRGTATSNSKQHIACSLRPYLLRGSPLLFFFFLMVVVHFSLALFSFFHFLSLSLCLCLSLPLPPSLFLSFGYLSRASIQLVTAPVRLFFPLDALHMYAELLRQLILTISVEFPSSQLETYVRCAGAARTICPVRICGGPRCMPKPAAIGCTC
jgi:hypothetical protein